MMTDLHIVGGGILGLAAAIQARQHGLTVKLFEKDPIPIGATRRNFGILGSTTLSHPDDCWSEYAKASIAFYQAIQDSMDISLTKRTGLYLATNPLQVQVLHEFEQESRRYGIQSQALSRNLLLQRYPYLDAGASLCGALTLADEYSLEPDQVAYALIEYAKRIGIDVYHAACVIKAQSNDQATHIELASGECLQAKKLLICHGATTEILYPNALQQIGIQRCHLNMALTEALPYQLNATIYSGLSIARYPGFSICPSYQALLKQPQEEIITRYGIHVLLKQNHLGQVIVGDSHEYTHLDQATLFEQQEQIYQFIQDYSRDQLGFHLPPLVKRWQGQYLSHPEQPACFIEIEPNIYLANAIAGKGMTTGPGWMKQQLKHHIF